MRRNTKPHNIVKVCVRRTDGSVDSRTGHNDLTCRGAVNHNFFHGTSIPHDANTARAPAEYANLYTGILDYKTDWTTAVPTATASTSASSVFVEYLPTETVNGIRYGVRVERYTITSLPSTPTEYKSIGFSSSARRYLWSFVNLSSPITASMGDVVEIEYTTYWEVYPGYDGSTPHPLIVAGSGSLNVVYRDIDGNETGTETRQYTVYAPPYQYITSNTPEQNMNRPPAYLSYGNQNREVLLSYEGMETSGSSYSSSYPRTGTTRTGYAPVPADEYMPENPFGYCASVVRLEVYVPAGGNSDYVYQALRWIAPMGAYTNAGTGTTVSGHLAAGNSHLLGTFFVLDSPITVPVESSAEFSIQVRYEWDPPQGFLDEFPDWVRPND